MTTTAHEPRAPVAGGWFTPSRSTPMGECVEVTFDHPGGLVRIRDSKDRGEGPTISVTGQQWTILLRAISDGTTLRFTKAKWSAFLAGAHLREFDYPGMSSTVT